MVAPADPTHRAAREQTVLALEIVLEEFLTGVAGAVIEAKAKLRVWGGMPPAVDPDLESPRKTKTAVDTRLRDDTGAEQGEYSPSEAGRPQATRRVAGKEITLPESVATDPRKSGAYRKGYAHGAAGEKPESPYGQDPQGAAAWLDKAWQQGWKAGSDALKATG